LFYKKNREEIPDLSNVWEMGAVPSNFNSTMPLIYVQYCLDMDLENVYYE